MDAQGVMSEAPFRLLGHLDLGDQVASCRIPAGEVDAGGFSDQAPSTIATHEILRPKRPAVGKLDVNALVVLHETCYLTATIDRHAQLFDPGGEDALDVILPQGKPVIVPR